MIQQVCSGIHVHTEPERIQATLASIHVHTTPVGEPFLGPAGGVSLHLGYNANHNWIQSSGSRPLVINEYPNYVGLGTDSPYTMLTVSGSIGFTNSTAPMLYIYQTGANNPERAIIAHSPSSLTSGLSYRDTDEVMIFQGNGIPVLTVRLGTRSVTIPTAQLSFGDTLRQGMGRASKLTEALR